MAAIYMWPVNEQVLLTTTLYPVEVIEKIEFGLNINGGVLAEMSHHHINQAQDLIQLSYTQKRWFYSDGPYEDHIAQSQDLILATYTQIRWFYNDGPYEDHIKQSQALIDITYGAKRVFADTPDELLQLGIAIQSTCIMEAV